ncbi:hypothetical protein L3Q82_022933 [Scortum barcoo]|uniref:Uncharacterized protein n=1 Tax=Scortum barcoo TaxID=214431 RepID=A0ACB8WWR4_9TELE|nr:hypothetical protein L3Q82_022933 [Scortum barcoo]
MFVRCSPSARYTLLFSHGNAVDLGQMSSFYIGLPWRPGLTHQLQRLLVRLLRLRGQFWETLGKEPVRRCRRCLASAPVTSYDQGQPPVTPPTAEPPNCSARHTTCTPPTLFVQPLWTRHSLHLSREWGQMTLCLSAELHCDGRPLFTACPERVSQSQIGPSNSAKTAGYGIRPENVIVYGQSIGTVPSVDLASRYESAAVILHSPLTSGMRVAFPDTKKTYCFDAFPNIDKISKVTSPVLVIHGTEDEVIDFSHGLALYERCQRPVEPLWVEGAGHNDVELYGQYLERLKQFVAHELVNL